MGGGGKGVGEEGGENGGGERGEGLRDKGKNRGVYKNEDEKMRNIDA